MLVRCIYRNFLRLSSEKALKTQELFHRNAHRWVSPTLRELKRRRDEIGPETPQPRSTYLEWNYEAELYAFGKRLNEDFDRELLKKALIHRSYSSMKKLEDENSNIQHSQELVSKGDEIINLYLSGKFGKVYNEDISKKIVEYLTSTELLSHVAKHLGLNELILSSEYPVEVGILSDTFKAIVAVLFQSTQNIEKTHRFIDDFVLVQLNGKSVFDIWEPKNPIKYLNEILEEQGIGKFEARLCNQSGINTILANYQVGLYSEKKLLGIGWGESVENARDTAALDAIQRILFGSKQQLCKYLTLQ